MSEAIYTTKFFNMANKLFTYMRKAAGSSIRALSWSKAPAFESSRQASDTIYIQSDEYSSTAWVEEVIG
jgi:hypothetical protein